MRVPPDRFVDGPRTFAENSPGKGQVSFFYSAGLEGVYKTVQGLAGPGDDHEPGGRRIKPVNDTRPEDTINEADHGIPVKESMNKGSGPVSRRGVDNKPCRLVYYEDIFIFVENAKFHGFRFQVQGLDLLDGHLDTSSFRQLQRGFGCLA